MDFYNILSIAARNQKAAEKQLPETRKYSTELSAPKKERKVKVQSEVLSKLREEKLQEELKKKRQQQGGAAVSPKAIENLKKKLKQEADDKKRGEKHVFKIPKSKPTPVENHKQAQERSNQGHEQLSKKQPLGKETKSKCSKKEKQQNVEKPRHSSNGQKNILASKPLSSKNGQSVPHMKGTAAPSTADRKPKRVNGQGVKPKAVGPMGFEEILRLAGKKSNMAAPAKSEVRPSQPRLPEGRPLTQVEKDRQARMQSQEYKNWCMYGRTKAEMVSETAGKRNPTGSSRPADKNKQGGGSKEGCRFERTKHMPSDNSGKRDSVGTSGVSGKLAAHKRLPDEKRFVGSTSKESFSNKTKASAASAKQTATKQTSSPLKPTTRAEDRMNGCETAKQKRVYDSTNERLLICRPVPKEPDIKLNPWDRIYGQLQRDDPKPKKFPPKRRRDVFDDDDEYDEDMDDFIDDAPLNSSQNYSRYIKEIFGYDKNRYRYESDSEINNMESSFAQQMKEEARSARFGLLEDLEDMKKEEEEMKKLRLAKKKQRLK